MGLVFLVGLLILSFTLRLSDVVLEKLYDAEKAALSCISCSKFLVCQTLFIHIRRTVTLSCTGEKSGAAD